MMTANVSNVSRFLRLPKRVRAKGRVLLGFLSGEIFEPYRPLMVHLTVTRRCNLSCRYCHEYDHTSVPVPFSTLCTRIDHLSRLRTVIVTLNGGEPLLHPDVAKIVAYIHQCNMTAAINTNGFLLTAKHIKALNEARLFAMQVSVDAVTPNEITQKALKPLLPKLQLLAKEANFMVRVNTVLGSSPPEEALEVVRTVASLGFDAKCSLMRNADGSLVSPGPEERSIYDQIATLERRSSSLFSEGFQETLLKDGRIGWKCRAGARFFHVCEDGLVHLCAPRYGSPAKPLSEYGKLDIRYAFHQKKSCTETCPVSYAHQISQLDRFRRQGENEGTADIAIARRLRLKVLS